MNRPTKDDVLGRLRSFTQQMQDVARLAETASLPKEIVDSIESMAWKSTYLAERLHVTGRDYVAPEFAGSLEDLANAADRVAETVESDSMKIAIRAPGQSLKAFVQEYGPKLTESGKFIFRFEED